MSTGLAITILAVIGAFNIGFAAGAIWCAYGRRGGPRP